MARIFNTLVPLLVLGAFVFVFHRQLFVFSNQAIRYVIPCTVPIRYTITSIDPRFDVSTSAVEAAADAAVAVWEAQTGKDVFTRVAFGLAVVEVSLEYDVRQQTTETLKDLGGKIDASTARYAALDAQYREARARFGEKKSSFEAASASFEQAAAAYQKEVSAWNARGGAPREVIAQLTATKTSLQSRQSALISQQAELSTHAAQVNAYVAQLNAMALDLNMSARTYNTVGATTGSEFEEGVFESRAGYEDIRIFEFDSTKRLERLMAHEFGHALGLDHVENSESIMYEFNQSLNLNPTKEDLAEFARACRT